MRKNVLYLERAGGKGKDGYWTTVLLDNLHTSMTLNSRVSREGC